MRSGFLLYGTNTDTHTHTHMFGGLLSAVVDIISSFGSVEWHGGEREALKSFCNAANYLSPCLWLTYGGTHDDDDDD